MPTRLITRTFRHQGRKFSVKLEPDFWAAVETISEYRGVPMGELLAREMNGTANLTRSVRLMALRFYRDAAEAACAAGFDCSSSIARVSSAPQ